MSVNEGLKRAVSYTRSALRTSQCWLMLVFPATPTAVELSFLGES